MQTTTNELSSLQVKILNRVLEEHRLCAAVNELRGSEMKSAADSAAFSRSVRRLHRRGLVIPCVYRLARKGERANLIMLTELGADLACSDQPLAESPSPHTMRPTSTAAVKFS